MSNAQIQKLDVLLCEPSPHMQTLIVQMLRHLSIRKIHVCATSVEALTELGRSEYGVIMVDDTLAPLNGIALTRKLRTNENAQNRDTPVIMMSSVPNANQIALARDAGITEFLRKPFSARHIESRLLSILKAPRSFIDDGGYSGPDRRRHRDGFSGTDRRSVN
ncbi:response regulator [Devosia sp.]|uniref:response regulator n=1 Tax=Devosia sp. TaxID=1871048 RepID=UPI003A8CDEB2